MSKQAKTETDVDKKSAGLVPKLRFPEFRNAPEWGENTVSALIETVTPPKKVQTAGYAVTGKFPIIDQSQNDIAGWTDDEDAVIRTNLPLIIFGDHTCNLKISSNPFVQGADGIKIFYGSRELLTVYLFQYLQFCPVKMEEYKRHFSILKNRKVLFPDRQTGEQQKIAECLSSIDELIVAQASKVEALKAHKKGLMQLLFPAEGQTNPQLRFPEFRDAPEWKKRRLDKAATFYNGRAYAQDELLEDGKYRVLRVGNFFTNKNWYYSDLELDETKYCDTGDLLYAWSASFGPRIWQGGKAIYHYHIWRVDNKKDTHKGFLYNVLSFETEKIKASSANGLGLMHVTKGAIESRECYFPLYDEQKKIADCLSSLDELIVAQASKVEALKAHKKGLMQQLFPTIDEAVA